MFTEIHCPGKGKDGNHSRKGNLLNSVLKLKAISKKAWPLKAFVKLMGDNGHIVNFSYSARDITNNQPAATVEFPQHQGTLNGDDVLHWARHCTALVALVQKYADKQQPTPHHHLGG